MIVFGIVGYLMKKLSFEGGPFILAFILGPIFENTLRQSLIMSDGSVLMFLMRPIPHHTLIAACLAAISPLLFRRFFKRGARLGDVG